MSGRKCGENCPKDDRRQPFPTTPERDASASLGRTFTELAVDKRRDFTAQGPMRQDEGGVERVGLAGASREEEKVESFADYSLRARSVRMLHCRFAKSLARSSSLRRREIPWTAFDSTVSC